MCSRERNGYPLSFLPLGWWGEAFAPPRTFLSLLPYYADVCSVPLHACSFSYHCSDIPPLFLSTRRPCRPSDRHCCLAGCGAKLLEAILASTYTSTSTANNRDLRGGGQVKWRAHTWTLGRCPISSSASSDYEAVRAAAVVVVPRWRGPSTLQQCGTLNARAPAARVTSGSCRPCQACWMRIIRA